MIADISNIAEHIKIGNGLDPLTEMGPMVSSAQQKRVHGYIEQGRSEGAQITTGGDAFGPGFFMKPTVLVDVNQQSSVVQEEIFGPVLVAMPFDDIDDVVRMANDSPSLTAWVERWAPPASSNWIIRSRLFCQPRLLYEQIPAHL